MCKTYTPTLATTHSIICRSVSTCTHIYQPLRQQPPAHQVLTTTTSCSQERNIKWSRWACAYLPVYTSQRSQQVCKSVWPVKRADWKHCIQQNDIQRVSFIDIHALITTEQDESLFSPTVCGGQRRGCYFLLCLTVPLPFSQSTHYQQWKTCSILQEFGFYLLAKHFDSFKAQDSRPQS